MKAVSLLLNSYLPEDLRNYDQTFDTKSINRMFYALAQKHPDKFSDALKKVSDLGRKASYYQGETISLKDLESVIDKKAILDQMKAEIASLPRDANFVKNRREIFQRYNTLIEKETANSALSKRNNIAMAVLSGARGKNAQLKAMISTPGTFSDYKGEPIDVFSDESFAEGITPTTFAASTNGTRASTVSTKCWEAYTAVRMEDLTAKSICTIKPGDCVLGSDMNGNIRPVHVLNVYKQGLQDVYKYTFCIPDGKVTVMCTGNHKLLSSVGPVQMKDAELGDQFYYASLSMDREWAVLSEVAHIGEKECYDIEVDHPDHMFVLANGIIGSNSSTAKGGDLAKQMAQSSADLVVRKENCGTTNGIAISVDDPSLRGRVLPRDFGGYKAGTFVTRDMIDKWKKAGVKDVEVRSALTCKVHGGLCAECVGKYLNGGKLPKVGTHVGVMVSTATMEPVTQMALCLYEHTRVRMGDGSVKEIKDICIGDTVLASDKHGKTKEVVVSDKFDQGTQPCYCYYLVSPAGTDEKKVICTQNHKFLQTGNVVRPLIPQKDLEAAIKKAEKAGKLFCKPEESHKVRVDGASVPYTVKKAAYLGSLRCFDIEVDHPDHLFVLENGLICSNSAKHTAGMTQAHKSYSGLGVITQFVQSPEKFKDRGTVSELAGTVEKVDDAPQGGKYVTVGGEKHYVPTGHEVQVRVGDNVEAGDQLSEGLVDAEDIVRLKGLGAGRKYYAERLNKILEDSGTPTDKRNTEILARGALRHVHITDPEGLGDFLPDDVADYNVLQDTYKKPATTIKAKPSDAEGKYLQAPAMHYTIGTKITPSVAKDLEEHGHNEIEADDKQPGFEPEMVRLRTSSHSNPDWLASMGTSYLSQQLNEASVRGDDTNVESNPDWRPRLAYGKDFGKNIEQTGKF